MAVLTNFLKLLKPEKNDYVDVDKHISENYDKIDNKMQELNTSNSGKLDKGALPTTIKSGKDLYDLIENNGGINIDTALLYLNDAGTKTAGKVYFDKNKKGLFECIKTTTNTVNSTEFFVDISNKASADRLTNLFSSFEVGAADALNSTPNTIHTHKFKKSFKKAPVVLATSTDSTTNVFPTIVGTTNTQFSFKINYTGNTNVYYLAIEY